MQVIKFLICLAVGLLVSGCSKKAADASEAADEGATPEAVAGKPAADANPHLGSALNSVNSDIDSKQYDAAVQKLLEAKIAAEHSEADRKLYEAKYREASNALREKAETDPEARASYESLGRAMMGR